MKTKVAALLIAVIGLTSMIIACEEFLLTELIPDNSVIVTFIMEGEEFDPVVLEKGETLGNRLPVVNDPSFLGWLEGFTLYTEDSEILADIILTAKFDSGSGVAEVIFDLNYDGKIATVIELSTGVSIGSSFPFDPRRQGYAFNGWLVNGQPFNRNSIVTESITATATWTAKTARTVTITIPGPHGQFNTTFGTGSGTGASMTRTRTVTVYDGDGIDEWGPQFPGEINLAADPDADRFYRFFRWSVGGTATGLVYTGQTPVTANVTLQPYVALMFHPRTFDINLSTLGITTPNTGSITRTPQASPQSYSSSTGWVTATFHAAPSFIHFSNHATLISLLANAHMDRETQFRWEIDYEFLDPSRDTPENQFNFLIANIRATDNWNSTGVEDQSLQAINGNPDEGTLGHIHPIAGTNSTAVNRNWVVVRGGRGSEVNSNGAFTIIIKSIKIHLLQ